MLIEGVGSYTALGLGITALMAILVLFVDRKYAPLPFLMMACFVPMTERIVILGADFTLLRILLIVCALRVLARGESSQIKWNSIDKAVLCLSAAMVIFGTLLMRSFPGLINRLGGAYDILGTYIFFRSSILDLSDAKRAVGMVALCLVPLGLLMLYQKETTSNPFAAFALVPVETIVREGRLRCQGPFAHPILAGSFASPLFVLMLGLWHAGRKHRVTAVLGMAASSVIVYTASSSGPVGSLIAGWCAWYMWAFRDRLVWLRRGIVLVVVGLHLVMKAPVWFVIAKVSIFAGSDAWHRAYIIDRAVANFSDWWFCGSLNPGGWGHSLFDVTNMYIVQGVNGGLTQMIIFILIIVRAFRSVGLSIRRIPEMPAGDRRFLWSMGCGLLAHVVTFMGVSYFDQNFVGWYLLIAMISGATGSILLTKPPEVTLITAEAAESKYWPAPTESASAWIR